MDYLLSLETSTFELTTFSTVHCRIYKLIGSPPKDLSLDEALSNAQEELNRRGLFATTDQGSAKLIIFTHSKTEAHTLLKPLLRLNGAKVTLHCDEGLEFESGETRDTSIHQLQNVPRTKADGDLHSATQRNPSWQRFRTAILTAVNNYVMTQSLRSVRGCSIGRNTILVPPLVDAKQPFALDRLVQPTIIEFNPDMSLEGKVSVRVDPGLPTRSLQTGLTVLSDLGLKQTSFRLLPWCIPATPKHHSLPSDKEGVPTLRSVINAWLSKKGLPAYDPACTYQWMAVEVSSEDIRSDHDDAFASNGCFSFEWPRALCVSYSSSSPTDSPEILPQVLRPDEFGLKFASEWTKRRDSRERAMEAEKSGREQVPPIPKDMLNDGSRLRSANLKETFQKSAMENEQSLVYPTPTEGLNSYQTPTSHAQDSPATVLTVTKDSSTYPRAASSSGEFKVGSEFNTNQPVKDDVSLPALNAEQAVYAMDISEDLFTSEENDSFKTSACSELLGKDRTSSICKASETKALAEESNSLISHKAPLTGSMGQPRSHEAQNTVSPRQSKPPEAHARSSQVTLDAKLASVHELNARYSDIGRFGQTHEAIFGKHAESGTATDIPKVGLPSSGSSDSEPSQSMSSSRRGSQVSDMTDEDAVSGSEEETSSAMHHLSPHEMENYLQRIHEPNAVHWLSKAHPKFNWVHLHWIFAGLQSQHQIDIIQTFAFQLCLLHNISRSEPNLKHSGREMYKCIAGKEMVDVISLSLPSGMAKYHTLQEHAVAPSAAKRVEQETRATLRKMVEEIDAPRLSISRHGSSMSLLHTATRFWTSLGLGPVAGPLKVYGICVALSAPYFAEGIKRFHSTMQDMYAALNLGHYTSISDANVRNGYFEATSPDDCTHFESLIGCYRRACARLGSLLLSLLPSRASVAIFLVDVWEDKRAILPLTVCFHDLISAFRDQCQAQHKNADAVDIQLRIVPFSWVSWEPGEAVTKFTRLVQQRQAFQLYSSFAQSRVRNDALNMGNGSSHPIQIEAQLPDAIPFEAVEKPPTKMLQQNSALHLAYAYTTEGNWLVASWTDDIGKQQASVTYPLKHQQLNVIIKEMWSTTCGFLQTRIGRSITWRLFVVKAGVLLPEELTTWRKCVSEEKPPTAMSVHYLSIDSHPQFAISLKESAKETQNETTQSPANISVQSPATATPGTAPTPETSGTSSGWATVAEPDADASARIVDVANQSWSLMLSHQPNTANFPQYAPSLASGLLIKRRTTSNLDAPVFVQVNLMHVDRDALRKGGGEFKPEVQQDENIRLLKQVIRSYRNLALVAHLRDIIGLNDTRPIHVAMVEDTVHELENMIEL